MNLWKVIALSGTLNDRKEKVIKNTHDYTHLSSQKTAHLHFHCCSEELHQCSSHDLLI